jgi:hypothetical protein
MAWIYIIPFGESRLTLPLAASIALFLLLGGYRRQAACWLLSFCAGLLVIVTGKLSFELAGWSLPSLAFYNISGHAMQTTAIYPLLLMLSGSAFGPRYSRLGAYLGLGAAVYMAVTLVTGNYHTLSETLAGMAIGLVVFCPYLRWRPRPRFSFQAWLIALPLCGGVAMLVLYGAANPVKHVLWQHAAHWLSATDRYTRVIYTDPVTGNREVLVLRHQRS